MLQRGSGGGGYYTREPGNCWSSDSLAKAYVDIVTNMRSNSRNVSDGRNLINRMWLSMVCALIVNDTRHHSVQNLFWTHSATLVHVSAQQILTTGMTRC